MRSLTAWLRVDENSRRQWIFIDADAQLAAVTQILFQRAARAVQKQLDAPGVYRLGLTGDLGNPEIEVAVIAAAEEQFILAQVLREAEEEVRIINVRFSAATDGANAGQVLKPDHLDRLITEAVASRTEGFILGKTEVVELCFNLEQ